jgi:hypothetical protein
LNRTGAFSSADSAAGDDNNVLLDTCGHWVLQQAVQQGAVTPAAVTALDACQPLDFICGKASKQLNTSLIGKEVTDRFAVLGGAMQDAVQEAQAGDMPGLRTGAAAPAAAKSAAAAAAAAAALSARWVVLAAAVAGVMLQLL